MSNQTPSLVKTENVSLQNEHSFASDRLDLPFSTLPFLLVDSTNLSSFHLLYCSKLNFLHNNVIYLLVSFLRHKYEIQASFINNKLQEIFFAH